MEFISETVAEGRVTTDPRVVVRLLEWVASSAVRTVSERDVLEAKFLALLHHLDFQQDGRSTTGWFCSDCGGRMVTGIKMGVLFSLFF